MKHPPVLPTIMVLVMVPVMIALGVWQLKRAEWKQELLAELAASSSLAPVDLDDGGPPGRVSFRKARATCSAGPQAPLALAGRSLGGAAGYSYRVRCRDDILVDAGWSLRPDAATRLTVDGAVSGIVLETPLAGNIDARYLIVADAARAPLEPSAPPSLDTIPNNHRAYAMQWFLFAATLLVIFGVYVRRAR